MNEKVKKEEKTTKCDKCNFVFHYTEKDVHTERTWLPWWLFGYAFSYVVCIGCGELLIIRGMR